MNGLLWRRGFGATADAGWQLEFMIEPRCLMIGVNWENRAGFFGVYVHLGPLILGVFQWRTA